MLIRTRLRLIAALPAAFMLIIGAGLWISWQQIDKVRDSAALTEDLRKAIFDQVALTQEYLLYGGARVESQLATLRSAMPRLLESLAFDNEEDRDVLASLRTTQQELDHLLTLLAKAQGESRNLIAGAVLGKTQILRLTARQLAERQQQNVVAIQRRADIAIIGLLLFLTGASILLLWLMGRRLAQAMAELGSAMAMVKGGDLRRRIRVAGGDELSRLAQSFNEMTDRLEAAEAALKVQAAALQRRTAELEAANADLESFSYSVSHDLRAPLRAIDGYSAIIREDHAAGLDEEGRRLFDVVGENAQKMARLIEDILAFSRAGRHELLVVPIDMKALAREVWRGLEPQREGRRIEFRLEELPPACGDPVALRQVLQNLLGNAVKFTRKRDPAVIEMTGRREGGEVCYTIRDNGSGFDMAYAGKLFVMFQRLHGMEEFEGTGVGLAIVKRFISKHGGRVWAEGRPEEGAAISFTLASEEACNEKAEVRYG